MKTIIVTLLLVVASTARAQTVPYVQWTPPPTVSSSQSYMSVPNFNSGYSDYEMMERMHYQNKVISSEIINSGAISFDTGNFYSIQVKTELKRNGNIKMKCIGIKMNNKWVSCECELSDLQEMYQQAKSQSERSSLLELMEFGNFIFKYGNTIYLIPKPE